MKSRYVVDTNVLIAASAINVDSPIAQDATPDDPDLRLKVWKWLIDFQRSVSRLVLDGPEMKIEDEYRRNMNEQDYGMLMLKQKWDDCAVDLVDVLYDDDGHAYLDENLAIIVHDRSDRKLVSAALVAIDDFGECWIANSGDTDWYDWEDGLREIGIEVEQIIPEWSRQKWREKHST
jgi:hypothetical protein